MQYRNRYYDSALGRFISRDPAGQIDGPSLYCYVAGGATRAVDPVGLDDLDASGLAAALADIYAGRVWWIGFGGWLYNRVWDDMRLPGAARILRQNPAVKGQMRWMVRRELRLTCNTGGCEWEGRKTCVLRGWVLTSVFNKSSLRGACGTRIEMVSKDVCDSCRAAFVECEWQFYHEIDAKSFGEFAEEGHFDGTIPERIVSALEGLVD